MAKRIILHDALSCSAKKCVDPDEFHEKGASKKTGALQVHHYPSNWDNPDTFDPVSPPTMPLSAALYRCIILIEEHADPLAC